MYWIIYQTMQNEYFDEYLLSCPPYRDIVLKESIIVYNQNSKYEIKNKPLSNFFATMGSMDIDCSTAEDGSLNIDTNFEFTKTKPQYHPISPTPWAKEYFQNMYRIGQAQQGAVYYFWRKSVGCLMDRVEVATSCEEVKKEVKIQEEMMFKFMDEIFYRTYNVSPLTRPPTKHDLHE